MLSRVVTFLLICFGLGPRVNAQEWFLSLFTPPSVTVSNSITYLIALTNRSGFFLEPVFVTNSFPTSLQFVGATSNGTTVTVAPGNVTFRITGGLDPDEVFPFALTLRPTQVGTVTNVVTATTPTAVSNITLQGVTVVNAPVARSDLTVAITPPTNSVFVDDWVPYILTVSRQGPDPISGVFLTNVLPPGAILRGYSPSNAVTVSSPRVIFDLGTMSLQSTQVNLTIQPTTTNLVLAAIVGAPAGSETGTNNNTATNTLVVLQPVLGELVADRISDQLFNRQNALFEQLIRVTYTGTSSVPSARVILSNFNFKVVNAVGTNDGNAFVVHAGGLSTNQPTVELLLEYFFPDRTAKPDPEFGTYSAGTIDLTPPSAGTNVAITNISRIFLPSNDILTDTNRVLLRFPATPGATYAITYMTNMSSAPLKAMPLLVAQANYVHWIDYGPPKTIRRLGSFSITNDVVTTNIVDGTNMLVTNMVVTNITSMRFYQAIQLP